MTPKQIKIAYILLASCFTLWLALILSACFSSGKWTTTIVFANQIMLALFEGAAVLSSISAMLLGLSFFDISFRPRKPKQNPKEALLLTSPLNLTWKKETPILKKPSEESEDNTSSKSMGKEPLLTEQSNEAVVIASVNMIEDQEGYSGSKDSMKAFYLFGETDFKHCAHELGYLGGSWKNKPIPDECFGCPKLIECFAPTKNK